MPLKGTREPSQLHAPNPNRNVPEYTRWLRDKPTFLWMKRRLKNHKVKDKDLIPFSTRYQIWHSCRSYPSLGGSSRLVVRDCGGDAAGAVISPLLGKIYLHYVLDLWVQRWRKQEAKGEVIIVRYGDDFILGFQYRQDAERFLKVLEARMQQFGLEVHSEKTRLIEFGRFAMANRERRGEELASSGQTAPPSTHTERDYFFGGTSVACQDTNCTLWPSLTHTVWNRSCSERSSPPTLTSKSVVPVMMARQP